ncbi:MAG: HAD-IIB family hydrolase, partial [Oceanospirillales bacterium]|nr:HAD-IIB family hydrolase [Oceanospirillales bacterium]
MPALLIVTDLDGTLLDHDSYSFDAALPALKRAAAASIPVIPNTSKTRAELLGLRARLGNADPFVIENGSAICIPEQHLHLYPEHDETEEGFIELPLGTPITEIQAVLDPLHAQFRFETFAQWSIDQVISHTGLSPEDAA